MTPRAALARFRHNHAAFLGAALVLLLVLLAVAGPWLIGLDPNKSDFTHGRSGIGLPAPPSAYHLLGTDTLYRDVASRLVHGARISLLIALLATFVATGIGAVVGLVAGYCANTRAWLLDTLLMRIVDAGLSFPYLLLVMALSAALDRTDATAIVVVLGITGWLGTSRVVRAKTIQLRDLDFVVASRALGQGSLRILLRHILPNVAGPIIVTSTSSVASMILAESVLGYLSLGLQPPTASWGRMLRDGQTFLTADPRLVAVPGIAILTAVLAFNLLGEGLRDALDPRTT